MRAQRSVLITVAALLAGASGCAVGPDFKRPMPPAATTYGSAPVQGSTAGATGPGGGAQAFLSGRDIPAEWWRLFGSAKLDRLVEQALAANPNVTAAQAALRQAHALYRAQQTSLFPTVQGGFSAARSKFATGTITAPTVASSATYSLYTPELTLSYTPDVFGGVRRAVETAKAQMQSARFELEATYVTLSTNVVVTAVQEASLREQIAVTRRLLALQHQLTQTVEHQRGLGTASQLDLLTQQSAEAQTAASLPPLEKQLGQTRDAFTALLGRLPSEEPAETFTLSDLSLPLELPVSVPSRLVEQRPDVREAEESLHAASAQVGVAIADLLPQFSIDADLGSAALTIGRLFSPYTGFWDAGASLTQTLFDAGALLDRRRAAQAALDEAAAQYRAAVILACQNVADTLRALQADASELRASAEAARAAAAAFALAQHQYRLGTISFVAVLNAEQLSQQAEIARVQAEANRYSDTAGLFQALGGGWWNRPEERPR